jgi:hypothetical protein
MRTGFTAALVLAGCLAASTATAGRVFGDIKTADGKPVAEGLRVRVAPVKPGAAPAVVDSTATDKFGSYKLTVKEEGKCVLTVVCEKQAATLEVFSYKDATRYDLVLEQKDGKWTLRRK